MRYSLFKIIAWLVGTAILAAFLILKFRWYDWLSNSVERLLN